VFPLIENKDLKIGRGKNNHVRLDDPRVGPRHCGIAFEYGRCLIFALESERGTFVNGFSRGGKILVHGDRIKIGISIFVFLDREEVDPALLKLTEAEENWYRSISYPRTYAYEAAKETVLDAFLQTIGSINDIRSGDELQARVFELIFQVIPAAVFRHNVFPDTFHILGGPKRVEGFSRLLWPSRIEVSESNR
jgi:pSer/pThr/pTyr-binding forkhead associated (FHA) protein